MLANVRQRYFSVNCNFNSGRLLPRGLESYGFNGWYFETLRIVCLKVVELNFNVILVLKNKLDDNDRV